MNILIYLIKTVLVSGLLSGYYWLFLRNRPPSPALPAPATNLRSPALPALRGLGGSCAG